MTVRLISQNKALHCYLILSVWILIVIGGLYKYFDWHREDIELVPVTTELFHNLGIAGLKTKRLFRICNFPEEIYQGEEGKALRVFWAMPPYYNSFGCCGSSLFEFVQVGLALQSHLRRHLEWHRLGLSCKSIQGLY